MTPIKSFFQFLGKRIFRISEAFISYFSDYFQYYFTAQFKIFLEIELFSVICSYLTDVSLTQKKKKTLKCSLFIALYHCYITFHKCECLSWNLLNLKQCNGICFKDSLPLKKRLPGIYLFRFLTYFRQQAMVFSSQDKAIIKNDYEGNGWTASPLCVELESENGYWVLFNVFWSDLRKMGSWKEELVLVDRLL